MLKYYGKGDEFHGAFHFKYQGLLMNSIKNEKRNSNFFTDLHTIQNRLPKGTQDILFLSNHDHYIGDRVATQLNGNEGKIKLSASLYILLSGIPTIYYGEEIGMKGGGSNDELRKSMEWEITNQQIKDPNSILNHYKRLLKIRNYYETSLSLGNSKYVPTHSQGRWDGYSNEFPFVSILREYGNEKMIVIHSFHPNPEELHLNLKSFGIKENSEVHVIMGIYHGVKYDNISTNNDGFYSIKQQFPFTTKILFIGNIDNYRGENDTILTYENALDWKPRTINPIPSPKYSILPIESTPRIQPRNSSNQKPPDTEQNVNNTSLIFASIVLAIILFGITTIFIGITISIVYFKVKEKKEEIYEQIN